jgi:anti-sigma factor RsiW
MDMRKETGMNCPIHNSEVLLEYCAGKLLPDAAAEFERHMSVCPECGSIARSQHHVWLALDTWEMEPVSQGFDRKLHMRIEEFEGRSWWRRLAGAGVAWRPALSLGAACAAIVVALVIYTPANRPPDTKVEVEPEQVERALDDLEMLKQLSSTGSQAF